MTNKIKKVIPFMQYNWLFALLSVLIVGSCIFLMATRGINYGVDFRGGNKLVYSFGKEFNESEIRTVVSSLNLGDFELIRFGVPAEKSFMIKVGFNDEKNVASIIMEGLKKGLGDTNIKILSEESVGPKVGAEMREKGIMAMLLTWALILVYIGVRFDFMFAPGAIVALVHDVVVTMGFIAFFGKEFSLPMLAAILTIIGFSINDTIVIYDRVRENIRKLPTTPLAQIINVSITETLSRTIITSLTVLFSVIVLFVLGGSVLHDFAFAMIVGVVAGVYSTVFIASAIYLGLSKLFPGKGLLGIVKK